MPVVSFFYFAMQSKIAFMFLWMITVVSFFFFALPCVLPVESHNTIITMNFLSHNFDGSMHLCAFPHLWFHMQRMMKIVAHKTEVNKTVTLGISIRAQHRIYIYIYIWPTNWKLKVCASQLLIHLINLLLPWDSWHTLSSSTSQMEHPLWLHCHAIWYYLWKILPVHPRLISYNFICLSIHSSTSTMKFHTL